MAGKELMKKNKYACFSSHLTKNERELLEILVEDFYRDRELIYDIQDLPIVRIKGDYLNFIERFQKKSIRLSSGEACVIVGILSLTEYSGDSRVRFVLNEQLKKYLTDEKYRIEYNLKSVISFKNEVTINFFYRVIQENMKNGSFVIALDDLKSRLDVKEYKRYYDFDRHILKNIAEDLKENSSYRISYEKIKVNNSIKKIKFSVINSEIDALRAKTKSLMLLLRRWVGDYDTYYSAIFNKLLYNDYQILRKRLVNFLRDIEKQEEYSEEALRKLLEGKAIEKDFLIKSREVSVQNKGEFHRAIFNELSSLLHIKEIGSMDYNTEITKIIYNLNERKGVRIPGKEVNMELYYDTAGKSMINIWQKKIEC